MKTIALKTTLLAVSSLGLITAATPAMAGSCGYGAASPNCQLGTTVNPGSAATFDPLSVNINQPMGFLRSVNYHRAPNVSITRLHGMMPSADVTDFPSSFTSGCHPTSTAYCRTDIGTPVDVTFNTPQPAPIFNAPTFSAPTFSAPRFSAQSFSAPVPSAPRIVAIGGGYDPSKFIPRVYGDNTLTPGIAHVPTSFVDRSPINAANALAGASYSSNRFGSMNLSSMPSTSYSTASSLVSSPVVSSPSITSSTSNPTTPVDSTGGYWEQVSGLTMFGDTVATSVVCRRQAPAPQPQVRVVRPVVGVPQAVPTPVPYFVDVPVKVRGGQIPAGCRPVGAPFAGGPAFRPQLGNQFGGGFGHAAPRPMLPHGPSAGWTF